MGRTDTAPGGSPASSMISATVSIVSGSRDGGLSTIGAARRDGRRDLVGGEVEREVEGADAGDRADREAARDADPTDGCAGLRSSGIVSPTMRSASSRAEPEDRASPRSTSARGVADGLARLPRDGQRRSRRAARGCPALMRTQGRAALVRGQRARLLEGRDRGLRWPPRPAPRQRGTCSPASSPGRAGSSTSRRVGRRPPSDRRGRSGVASRRASRGQVRRLEALAVIVMRGHRDWPRRGGPDVSRPTAGLRTLPRVSTGRIR